MDIAGIRKDYRLKALEAASLLSDPIDQFSLWFQEAVNAKVNEPNAMVLSTVGEGGQPKARVLLLKGVEDGSLVFYTNYTSNKAKELEAHSLGAITFHWAELERQVRVEGTISKVAGEVSDVYYNSRPRESRIGAHVSPQSQPIADRAYLENRFIQLTKEFEGKEVPRPKHWGGYALKPVSIEFWQGRPSRLHDRFIYKSEGDSWVVSRLAP